MANKNFNKDLEFLFNSEPSLSQQKEESLKKAATWQKSMLTDYMIKQGLFAATFSSLEKLLGQCFQEVNASYAEGDIQVDFTDPV